MNTNSMTQRVDASALSENSLFSHDNSHRHATDSSSFRLFQSIIRLGYAWQMYYGASTQEAKNKAILQINLLQAERDRVLGTMLS